MYLYLGIALICLSLLGIFHKLADVRHCRPSLINLFLFIFAALGIGTIALARSSAIFPPASILLVGIVCGCLASVAILTFQKGIRYGRIATSWLVINLSTAIPTIGSVLIYHEQVTRDRAMGLGFMLFSVVLLYLEKRQHTQDSGDVMAWARLMAVAFVANGLGVFGVRILAAWGFAETYADIYLAIWYGAGALFALIPAASELRKVNATEIALAALMGASSLGGQFSMAAALGAGVPGYVVYPFCLGGGLLFVVAAGVLIFRERVRAIGYVGLAAGIMGVIFLALPS